MADKTKHLLEQIQTAYQQNRTVKICGGGSKQFLSPLASNEEAEEISTLEHTGIINYLPSELTVTVRSGTKLSEVQQTLAEKGQMLAFEPPSFNENTTIGGAIASGLSGPRRPFTGSARDFVLGTEVINGKGEYLKFGGEVMKNVAGYDVSRLMTGSNGKLGLITSVSLKILPLPEQGKTVSIAMDSVQFIETVQQWLQQSYPISAAAHFDQRAYFRFSASQQFVEQSISEISQNSDITKIDNEIWQEINNQRHSFFSDTRNLWRVMLPMYTSQQSSNDFKIDSLDNCFHMTDWGGACRWLYTDSSIEEVRKLAEQADGTAKIFRDNGQYSGSYTRNHSLAEPIQKLEQRIQQQFDPKGILKLHHAN